MIPSRDEAVSAVETIVRYIEGKEGVFREGVFLTPGRVVDSYDEMFSGYDGDSKEILKSTFNAEGYDGIVLLRDVEFHSTCEHHLQPFSGRAHIAYIPVEKIAGISKLARLLDLHSKQLQNQERITKGIADDLEKHLRPLGCAVIIEAQHGCMTGRGVRTPGVGMITSRMMGTFLEDQRSRKEVLSLMGYG